MTLPSPDIRRMRMSSAQRRLFLQCQLPGGDRAYHLLHLVRVRGPFPLAAAQAFASGMLERHESLRTSFRVEEGDLISEIHPRAGFSFTVIDGAESDLDEIVRNCDTPFDLAVPPLLRCTVLRLGAAECILIFVCHHLIFDGYSAGILDGEIRDAIEGRQPAPLDRTYRDFVQWEEQFFQGREYERQRDYWTARYGKEPARLALPHDFTPPVTKSFEGDYFILNLPSERLKEFSRAQGTTLFATLLAAFHAVLYRLTGQAEITLGTLISPRESGSFQRVIGLFANTLPLTQTLTPHTRFSEFLSNVQAAIFQALQHADYPFEHLVRQLPFLEKGARNPLFDVVFNFERVARSSVERIGDVTVEALDYYSRVSMFDLAIDLVEYEDQVRFKVEYATTLFRRETIEGVMDAYFGVIRQVCRQPDIPVGDLPLVAEEGYEQLRAWNDTARPLKKGWTFLDTWKQQLACHADNPAVRGNGRELSYARLEERANRLAHYLISQGIGAGTVVAVAMERSPEWVIALLALWKAGAVYLPLAASHPRKRIAYQVADSTAALVLTDAALYEHFAGLPRVVSLDSLEPALSSFPGHAPGPGIDAAQPAYCIYTSGSTGTPKGVVVTHHAVHAHIEALKGVYKLQPDDNVLQFSSPVFDASLEQILATLAAGACLVLPDARLVDPGALLDRLAAEEVTVAEFPPAYLRELLPVLTPHSLRNIRLLLSGGDVLTAPLAREVMKHLPVEARLLNVYGPTEATMAATVYQVRGDLRQYDTWLSIPIGRPLPNTRIYILDANHRPVPVGIPGELCIAGDRLAQGYLNREDLTAEKFVHIELPGSVERVYKTGDRARRLRDGTIEFLGRRDRQVQVRGYRIELAEIELALRRHPGVLDAVVLNRGGQGEALAAFVTAEKGVAITAGVLYEWLRDSLPDYMIPAAFTVMDAIPRTIDGKLDRHALAAVPVAGHAAAGPDMPLDALEFDLWNMWRDILKLPHIGRNEVFFHIGGNSLGIIQVMVEVRNRYRVDIPLSLLLQSPTIAGLADFLRTAAAETAPSPVVALNRGGGARPSIILIPGQGGDILDLYELSAALDKSYPCYGLQHPWDGGASLLNDSIEDLAQFHLRHLETALSPEGCILVGHSFGGHIAYEMARVLEQQGQRPRSLLLLDVVAPGDTGGGNPPLTEHDVLGLTVSCLTGGRDGAPWELPAGRGEGAYAAALDYLKAEQRLPDSLSVDTFRQQVRTIARRGAAFSRYRPASRIHTDICLFRASEPGTSRGGREASWDWGGLTAGRFTQQWVGGDHFTMLKGGNAAGLAEEIIKAVSGADGSLDI